jgi:hypothetical protein
MTASKGSTFDPRQRREFDGTSLIWEVASNDDEGLADEGTITTELAGLSEKVDQLCQRPLKWATQIRDLGDPQLVLVQPIQIVIEEYASDDSVIARYPEVEVFGEGETEPEAILRLKEDIVRLYRDLINSSPDELGTLPQSWLRVLRQIISEEKA